MADQEAQQTKPAEQEQKTDQQPQGGDHIPTGSKDEEQEDTGSGGLLGKVGDPIGMLPSVKRPSLQPPPSQQQQQHAHTTCSNIPQAKS